MILINVMKQLVDRHDHMVRMPFPGCPVAMRVPRHEKHLRHRFNFSRILNPSPVLGQHNAMLCEEKDQA